jgi:hypothetical protein
MKLLARIISHGFAIAVVLLLAVSLIYRGKLFPEYDLPRYLDIGKLADHQKEPATEHVDQDTTEAEAGAPILTPGVDREQATILAVVPESKVEVDTGEDTAGVITETETEETTPAEHEVIVRDEVGGDTLQASPGAESEAPLAITEEVVESPEEGGESPEEASMPESVSPVPGQEDGQQRENELSGTTSSPAGDSGSAVENALQEPQVAPPGIPASPDSEAVIPQDDEAAVSPAKPQEKAYQLLAEAREAYWLRDYDTAEAKYNELTRLEPENPDGYGELGNMYFSQGTWDQAASAYYEAGVRLVRQGLLEQAEELVAVIRGLNSAHADDLDRVIQEARSTEN